MKKNSRFPERKKEAEIMDFSQESNLEEKLLGQLRSAFWGKFEDDDLASVHAAGKPPVYRLSLIHICILNAASRRVQHL